MKPLAPAVGNTKTSCDVSFTAIIDTPTGSNTSLYRFQSIGHVYAAEITADPTKYPLGYYEVYTPPYLFNIGGGIPSRGESSP